MWDIERAGQKFNFSTFYANEHVQTHGESHILVLSTSVDKVLKLPPADARVGAL